ncbi:PREDICTED: pupal cuticle protein 36a-like [Papilio xuthus]|uniref:Pupal cuticle protein 36a-like n=1 Tax=Papilio xuthus TaxID=66420 RepID=A0AAJ6Z0M8_PAPXU|nr:PREDICTED: pupal cuticle protein 36a-like [Papilio xuthus]
MKLFILAVFIAYSSAAKLNRAYLPPNYAQTSGGSGDFLQTPLSNPTSFNNLQGNDGFIPKDTIAQFGNEYTIGNTANGRQNDAFGYTRAERPRAALERNAAILRQANENDGERYSYAFETENGIIAEENGVATNGVEAQGGYSYTGDDGQVYSVRYTAGQNGFVPEGDHLPTPPPIPQEIQLALEQNARDEAAGIYDDGSYNENKYGNDNGYATPNLVLPISNINNEDSIVVNSATNTDAFQPGFGRQNQESVFNQQNGINKAYLPPISEQRSSGKLGGFGIRNRQPTFNSRNGYNY